MAESTAVAAGDPYTGFCRGARFSRAFRMNLPCGSLQPGLCARLMREFPDADGPDAARFGIAGTMADRANSSSSLKPTICRWAWGAGVFARVAQFLLAAG